MSDISATATNSATRASSFTQSVDVVVFSSGQIILGIQIPTKTTQYPNNLERVDSCAVDALKKHNDFMAGAHLLRQSGGVTGQSMWRQRYTADGIGEETTTAQIGPRSHGYFSQMTVRKEITGLINPNFVAPPPSLPYPLEKCYFSKGEIVQPIDCIEGFRQFNQIVEERSPNTDCSSTLIENTERGGKTTCRFDFESNTQQASFFGTKENLKV